MRSGYYPVGVPNHISPEQIITFFTKPKKALLAAGLPEGFVERFAGLLLQTTGERGKSILNTPPRDNGHWGNLTVYGYDSYLPQSGYRQLDFVPQTGPQSEEVGTFLAEVWPQVETWFKDQATQGYPAFTGKAQATRTESSTGSQALKSGHPRPTLRQGR
jgi:hypothetical protein